ncbi:hypothetical protein IE53DRAFT_383022 [Violaceomyces palustris]|uniref:Uncharacterized protein n=1 Tax=Violaceomyces palustris TaxID=1673888 RepID=A0ACD0P8J6_9BASI|nr:hypothetical protein IE53DRAFT_383022 [Violaceomyces palustris]
MPTYADDYNERIQALGHDLPSGPVRLTISKGDYVQLPATGKWVYLENWQEEDLMDLQPLEQLESSAVSHHRSSGQDGKRNEYAASGLNSILPDPGSAQTLWVLDTNVLLSNLPFIKALFAVLLNRSISAIVSQLTKAGHCRTTPAPIAMVIPHIVLSELDGLKTSPRTQGGSTCNRPISSLAREANRWMLAAIQAQKRAIVPIPCDGQEKSEALPENGWVFHIQSSRHAEKERERRRERKDSVHLSNDEEIVSFCSHLSETTYLPVVFCSNDTNARTRAEADGITSLEMEETIRELRSSLKLKGSGVGLDSEAAFSAMAEEMVERSERALPPDPSTGQRPVPEPCNDVRDLDVDMTSGEDEPTLAIRGILQERAASTPGQLPRHIRSSETAVTMNRSRSSRSSPPSSKTGRKVSDSIHATGPRAQAQPDTARMSLTDYEPAHLPSRSPPLNPTFEVTDFLTDSATCFGKRARVVGGDRIENASTARKRGNTPTSPRKTKTTEGDVLCDLGDGEDLHDINNPFFEWPGDRGNPTCSSSSRRKKPGRW